MPLYINHTNIGLLCSNIYNAATSSIEFPLPKSENNCAMNLKRHMQMEDNAVSIIKRHKLHSIERISNSISFEEFQKLIKTSELFFHCSTCSSVSSKIFKQCHQGHIFCENCCNTAVVYCYFCDKFYCVKDLSISILAAEMSKLQYMKCEFCHIILSRCNLDRHLQKFCEKNKLSCAYELFGCNWQGCGKLREDHILRCDKSNIKVKDAFDVINSQFNRFYDVNFDQINFFKKFLSAIRSNEFGNRIVLKNVALSQSKIQRDDANDCSTMQFESSSFYLPHIIFPLNGFKLILELKKQQNHVVMSYALKSERNFNIQIKFALFYCNFDYDSQVNHNFIDEIHNFNFYNETQLLTLNYPIDFKEQQLKIQLAKCQNINVSILFLINDINFPETVMAIEEDVEMINRTESIQNISNTDSIMQYREELSDLFNLFEFNRDDSLITINDNDDLSDEMVFSLSGSL